MHNTYNGKVRRGLFKKGLKDQRPSLINCRINIIDNKKNKQMVKRF